MADRERSIPEEISGHIGHENIQTTR